jgi:hypothetical protein
VNKQKHCVGPQITNYVPLLHLNKLDDAHAGAATVPPMLRRSGTDRATRTDARRIADAGAVLANRMSIELAKPVASVALMAGGADLVPQS